MEQLRNIKERLAKVLILVPANKQDAVQQLLNDCKWLVKYIEGLPREEDEVA